MSITYWTPGCACCGREKVTLRKYDAAGTEVWSRLTRTARLAIDITAGLIYVYDQSNFGGTSEFDLDGNQTSGARTLGGTSQFHDLDVTDITVDGAVVNIEGTEIVALYDDPAADNWSYFLDFRPRSVASSQFIGQPFGNTIVAVGGDPHDGPWPRKSEHRIGLYSASGPIHESRFGSSIETGTVFAVAMGPDYGVWGAGLGTTLGTSGTRGRLVRFDNSMNPLWKAEGAADSLFHSVAVDRLSNAYVAHIDDQTLPFSEREVRLEAYDPDGNPLWSRVIVPDLPAVFTDNDHVWVTGLRREDATLGHVTTQKFSLSGELLWSRDHGSNCADLYADGLGNIYTVGNPAPK